MKINDLIYATNQRLCQLNKIGSASRKLQEVGSACTTVLQKTRLRLSDFVSAQPFALHLKDYVDFDLPDKDQVSALTLAMPFECVSIEGFRINLIQFSNIDAELNCIVMKELSPGEYRFHVLNTENELLTIEQTDPKAYFAIKWIAAAILQKINSNEFIHGEEVIEKSGSKNRKGKKIKVKRIKKVVHIYPRRAPVEKRPSKGEKSCIIWSHAWVVRGHWRRFDGLGKDRTGARTVEGFTFIKEHTKGDTTLIEKTRIVHFNSGGK